MIKISVIIPTYNRQYLTQRAIDSIQSKNPSWVEIIVVDDAGIQPFIHPKKFNKFQIPIKIIRMKTNSGAGLARKEGVKSANGSHIAFLDSDDIFKDDWINILYENINKINTEDRILYVGKTQGGKRNLSFVRNLISLTPSLLRLPLTRFIICFFNPFYTPSVAAKKEIIEFHESLRFCEDYYTNASIIFNAKKIMLIDDYACTLSRPPSAEGGLSANHKKMSDGEIIARSSIMNRFSPKIYYPFFFFGFIYQKSRTLLKIIFK